MCGLVEKVVETEPLKERVANLEKALRQSEQALAISQKRYEIAMRFSDVTIFDYNIKTKKILTQAVDFEVYGMPGTLESGVDDVLKTGIIAQRSRNDIRELYRKIDGGAPSASATIYANDLNGSERTLMLQMVTIFDRDGTPAYSVGMRKDITDAVCLRNEQKYSNLLSCELTFIYEADVTHDRVSRYDENWAHAVGLNGVTTLTGLLQLMCERHIAPADQEVFYTRQSRESILAAFREGERIISFEYRKWVESKGYEWFEVRINLVQDEITHDINMRVYIVNIDDKKKAEVRAAAARKRYELTLSKSAAVYEVNITANAINMGHDALAAQYGTLPNETRCDEVLPLILSRIHPHDRERLAAILSRPALLEAYAAGKTDLSCEYRRGDSSENCCWYRCSLQLFDDPLTHDVLGYVYVEDINEEKEKELQLLYRAQHDPMTGFYNKNTVEEKIDRLLASADGKAETHVFFIIDLDSFKRVNDTFGHAFGDAVLSQTAAKISALFRSGDILGRIGGDEFVVLMRNVKDDKIALLKAQEICDSVREIYVQSDQEYRVTVSIGIAVYARHGDCYSALYRHSDTALYDAKELGRNRFSVYNDHMTHSGTAVNGIDARRISETTTFESSVSEYVFRILYEAQDKRKAINAVLELMGKHYRFSRVYVFEDSEDGLSTCNTFEWCGPEVKPEIQNLQKLSYAEMGNYKANFDSEGIFCLDDVNALPSPIREGFGAQCIKSMVQFAILKNNQFAGFIGFDECARYRSPESRELNDYRNFANMLGMFIVEMRALEKLEAIERVAPMQTQEPANTPPPRI